MRLSPRFVGRGWCSELPISTAKSCEGFAELLITKQTLIDDLKGWVGKLEKSKYLAPTQSLGFQVKYGEPARQSADTREQTGYR